MGFQTGKSKQTFKTDVGTTYCYHRYIKDYSTTKGPNDKKKKILKNKYNITQKKFTDILKVINQKIRNEIITKNFEYKMPFRFGTISVVKFKNKPFVNPDTDKIRNVNAVNWIATHKMWEDKPETKHKKVIRYDNKHTDNYVFTIKYNKQKAKFGGYRVYDFYPTREFNRELANHILSNSRYDAPLRNKRALYYELRSKTKRK